MPPVLFCIYYTTSDPSCQVFLQKSWKNFGGRPGGPARHRPRPPLGDPRSVHTHFQGLCVVFGLLFYIPSARLTEQLVFPPLRLCESAESDLITSVCVKGKEFPLSRFLRTDFHSVLSASLLRVYYTATRRKSQPFF